MHLRGNYNVLAINEWWRVLAAQDLINKKWLRIDQPHTLYKKEGTWNEKNYVLDGI